MNLRLTEAEAKEQHEQMMKDPEYRRLWEDLISGLYGMLADLPKDALETAQEKQ